MSKYDMRHKRKRIRKKKLIDIQIRQTKLKIEYKKKKQDNRCVNKWKIEKKDES